MELLEAITMLGNDGVIARATVKPYVGAIVLFVPGNAPEKVGVKIYCYDWEQRTSKKGKIFFVCRGWAETREEAYAKIVEGFLSAFPEDIREVIEELIKDGAVPTPKELAEKGIYMLTYDPSSVPVTPGREPCISVCTVNGKYGECSGGSKVVAEGYVEVSESIARVAGEHGVRVVDCEGTRLTNDPFIKRTMDAYGGLPDEILARIVKAVLKRRGGGPAGR